MHRKISTLCLIVAFALTLNGCSSMSPQARRERAYRHYVQQHIRERQKQTARAQKAANRQLKQKLKNLQPSDPQVSTSVRDVSAPSFSEPEAAPSQPVVPQTVPSFSEEGAAPSQPVVPQTDTVVPPVTVSASDAVAAQDPDQPSQP